MDYYNVRIKDLPSPYKEMAIANVIDEHNCTKGDEDEILDLPLVSAFTFTPSKHPQENEEGIYFWVHVLQGMYPNFIDEDFPQQPPNEWVKEVTNLLVCERITWDEEDLRDKLK
jgi:hypothetical protein